jgi:subtilisin family serine protease
MKKNFIVLMVSLLATAAMAQVKEIPADTRLYLQTLENSYKQARARSMNGKVKQKEARLFLSCAPDADMKAIESQLKAIGARPQGTIGRYIMVSTSVNVADQIADIEGVTFINRSPAVSQKTLVSREATGVSKVHQGTDGLPQAFTGKGVVVGVVDGGFDFDHPAFLFCI